MCRLGIPLAVAVLVASALLVGCAGSSTNAPQMFEGVFAGYSSLPTPGLMEFQFTPHGTSATSPSPVTFVADSNSQLYVRGSKTPEGLVAFMNKAGPDDHAPLEVFTVAPDSIEYVESNGTKRIIAIRVP